VQQSAVEAGWQEDQLVVVAVEVHGCLVEDWVAEVAVHCDQMAVLLEEVAAYHQEQEQEVALQYKYNIFTFLHILHIIHSHI